MKLSAAFLLQEKFSSRRIAKNFILKAKYNKLLLASVAVAFLISFLTGAGVSVVNIDNGFGTGVLASKINKIGG